LGTSINLKKNSKIGGGKKDKRDMGEGGMREIIFMEKGQRKPFSQERWLQKRD